MKKINFTFADGITKQIDLCENVAEISNVIGFNDFNKLGIKSLSNFSCLADECAFDAEFANCTSHIIEDNLSDAYCDTNIDSNNISETACEDAACFGLFDVDSDILPNGQCLHVIKGKIFKSTLLNEPKQSNNHLPYAFFKQGDEVYVVLYYTYA